MIGHQLKDPSLYHRKTNFIHSSLLPPQQQHFNTTPNRISSPQNIPPLHSPPTRITFNHPQPASSPVTQLNSNVPAFRDLRQRYVRTPSATVVQIRSAEKIKQQPRRQREQRLTRAVRQQTRQQIRGESVRQKVSEQNEKFERERQIEKVQNERQIEKVQNEQVQDGQLKQQKLKYDRLKTTFDSSQTVFVDKKLNVIEVGENRSSKVETTNTRIECILQQKQVLEQSRALFSEISYLKKKVNDFQQNNDRLRAQVYTLKTKLAQEEEKREQMRLQMQRMRELKEKQDLMRQQMKEKQEAKQSAKVEISQQPRIEQEVRVLLQQLRSRQQIQSELQKQVRMLRIDLQKSRNEQKMSKINQSQISKKCQSLSLKNRQQQLEIERLRSMLNQKDFNEDIPQNSMKSEPATQTVTYILN